jgi:uncharacterized protein
VPSAAFAWTPADACGTICGGFSVESITMRGVWLRGVLGALLLVVGGVAMAQDLTLYEGEAVVDSQSEAARDAALPQALAAALVRLTGDPAIADDPAVRADLARAPTLLQQFRYRQEADPATPGLSRSVLVARFDPAGVDALIALGGRSVWPSPRPTPVVWLAIDDGRGARMLGSAQAQAVAALTARARERGLALTYPLLDLEEQRSLVVSAFWAGDSAAARRASPRYQSRVSLVGKLYRSASGWTAEWALYDGEQRLAETTPSAPEAASVLAAGADLAADTLAARAAEAAQNAGQAGRYRIWIEGLHSAEDYARTLAYLQRLSVVRGVSPLQVDGARLQVEVDMNTGLEGLSRLIETGTTLRLLDGAHPADSRSFRLEP